MGDKSGCRPFGTGMKKCEGWLRAKWRILEESRRRFHEWQRKPYCVKEMSQEEHECSTCHTIYTGNFCPRCGQSRRIGRYSFKTAMFNFLDVWGLGNRGMFRTIRDLLLRPGFMIRDYIGGMQMAYYPPFKMFFLLAALSIVVTHGVNIKGSRLSSDSRVIEVASQQMSNGDQTVGHSSTEEVQVQELFRSIAVRASRFQERFPNIFALLVLMYISGCLYLFFRRCPGVPGLRYSEFFVSLVYITNMYSIISIVFSFFCVPILSVLSFFLIFIPLKQLSGYGWWRVIAYSMLSLVAMLLVFGVIVVLIAIAATAYVGWGN
ncbi:MAG: DUF3667 domain-containing protein [Bacteroidales bacterium]|nr:DUF3667 domain-containing protein [Bacteroidales bacterium]